MEHHRIKFPRPALLLAVIDLTQGMIGHIFEQERLLHRLRRRQNEAGVCGLIIGIELVGPVRPAGTRRPAAALEMLCQLFRSHDHQVADDQPAKPLARHLHRGQGYTRTKAVGDDPGFQRTGEQVHRFGHRNHALGTFFTITIGGHLALAHTRQIISDNVIVCRQKRRDKGEAAGMRQKAMGHQQRRLAARAPAEIMDLAAVYFDKSFFARHRHRVQEPGRQVLIASPNIDNIRAGRFHFFIHRSVYSPFQSGLRFWAKASEPSCASFDVNTGPVISACFFQASSLVQS